MAKKSDNKSGMLIRIFKNKDIQKGIAFFSIALILAFAAIIPVTAEEVVSNEVIDEGSHNQNISFPGYRVINATLNVTTTGSVTVNVQDSLGDDANVILTESAESDNDEYLKTIYLTDIDPAQEPSWLNFTGIQGNLSYTYTLKYSQRPYGLLSLPAGLFTLIGMVFSFRGKGVILGEIRHKQMEEETRKRRKERVERIEEEKSPREDKVEGVIFEGERTKEKKGEADHINFMGLPDKEDEEDQEK